MPYYAWSTIRNDEDVVNPGDAVVKEDLDLTQPQFDALVATGAIKQSDYPPVINANQSPMEYVVYKAQYDEDHALETLQAQYDAKVTELADLQTEYDAYVLAHP